MNEEKCKHKYNGKCMPFECICNLAKGEQCQLLFMEAENKRLREALEKISKKKEINGCTCFYETEDGFSDCENCDVNMGCTYYIAKQALGE